MIKIKTEPSEDVLYGESKWWGFPDLPDELDWPTVQANDDGELFDDPLTFICQIKCSDLAPVDPEGLLPHEGMLYFFGALDYFLGDLDAFTTPGMGEWPKEYFRVLYSPVEEGLNTHTLFYDEEDEIPACPAPEKILFVTPDSDLESYTWLLGEPFAEETREALPGYTSLLQIDENDDWGLRFFDCGMLCFMIKPADLKARRFDKVKAWLYSA
ncbi:MAG: DUF1963 domain-containing protein [Bacteroidales bacterium]|nr:DUF1963 domain-containing protein [Bacteroidales bacterium]